ncbi:DUF6993 domain-containing protein [Microbacterium sp. NPDC091662]|uniref:DUF6993 domain-containing protein n=1 Tax=Microbacterium sp. NPDC091662 TaxID=3364211 RepID=UPI00380F2002
MFRRSVSSPARAAGILAVTAVTALLLSGCTPGPAPSVSPSSSPSADAEPTTPAAPVLVPDGSAEDNLPVFTATAEGIWATEQRGSGRAYIDALIGAGFDRESMQVTQDQTTVGNPAESLQFSVRWGQDECLVGQVGPSTGQVVTAVLPQLAEGRCLIGTTRPIDW